MAIINMKMFREPRRKPPVVRRPDEVPDYGDPDFPRFSEAEIDDLIRARFHAEREKMGIVHEEHKEKL